jgi:hypothetical protein
VVETRERDRISNLAKSNPSAALEAARLLSDPFTKCQALAWVSRYTTTPADAVKVAVEAERAATLAADSWDTAAGVAWVVRALVERDRPREADAALQRAVAAAQRIDNPVRRVDALFLLVQGGWAAAGAGWKAAVQALVAAAASASSTKPQSVLRDLVLMLAREGRDFSAALAAIPDGKFKRQAERRLESREYMSARPFFW